MIDARICFAVAAASFAIVSGPAHAQTADADNQENASQQSTQYPAAEPEINPDEMASELNRQQSFEQTYTFTRTINGEVIEKEKKTIKYSPNNTVRPTEAGETALETLTASFDNELLTRKEAFEEARLDFTVADVDRDGNMTADEFANLVLTWRDNDIIDEGAPNAEIERQKRYVALLEAIDPEAADEEIKTEAKKKFAFMAGVAPSLSQKDYIREYLLDFDSMDKDNDMLLRGDELMLFRAANRGASIGG